MINTQENRINWCRAQFSRLTQGVDKRKLLIGVKELASTFSEKRKIEMITRWAELRSKLWGKSMTRHFEESWGGVWSELRDGFGSELRSDRANEFRAELTGWFENELKSELDGESWNNWEFVWEYYESIWALFIREFRPNLKVVKRNKKKIDALQKIVEAGNCYLWISKDTIYVLPFPEIHLDEGKRLHNTKGYALKIADKKTYWIHGVKFPKTLWQRVKNPRVRLKTILSLKNTEQRMAVLRLHGIERVLEKGKLIHKSKKGNELYLVEGVFRNPTYFLKFSCPSTGRVFVEGVRPDVGKKGDADLAQASMWGLTKKEYLSLKIET